MLLFKSKNEKMLDELINRIKINMSNNYKDAAQEDFARFEQAFSQIVQSGELSGKKLKFYQEQYDLYQEKMIGYTHKDQKPYWT